MTLISTTGGALVAFGRNKQRQSYGVPVRAVTEPAGPAPAPYEQSAAAAPPPWAAVAPPASAGFYPPAVSPPAAFSAPYAPAYNPAAPATNPYAPLAPAAYAGQPGWAPTPPGYPPGFGPPQPPYPPVAAKTGLRRVINSKPVAAVVIVMAVAGLGNAARLGAGDPMAPITMPESLAGSSRMTDATTQQFIATELARFQARNPRIASAVALYQEPGDRQVVVLLAARGRLNERSEVADSTGTQFSIDGTTRRAFGHGIACYRAGASGALCLLSGRVSLILLTTRTADLDAAATITGEARTGVK